MDEPRAPARARGWRRRPSAAARAPAWPNRTVGAGPPPVAIHELFVDGRFDRTTITGDRSLLERLVEAAPEPVALP